MRQIKVETMDQYLKYRSEFYTSSVEDIRSILGVKLRKARELLRDAPGITIGESLYNELKKNGDKVYRKYYETNEVIKYLILKDQIRVKYGDARKVYSKLENTGKEIHVDKNYLLDNMHNTFFFISLSKPLSDIIIEDIGFEFFSVDRYGEPLYIKGDVIGTRTEIYTRSDVVKYTRMIKRDFYVKCEIGGTVKYFQSMRSIKVEKLEKIIEHWIKEYEAKCIL